MNDNYNVPVPIGPDVRIETLLVRTGGTLSFEGPDRVRRFIDNVTPNTPYPLSVRRIFANGTTCRGIFTLPNRDLSSTSPQPPLPSRPEDAGIYRPWYENLSFAITQDTPANVSSSSQTPAYLLGVFEDRVRRFDPGSIGLSLLAGTNAAAVRDEIDAEAIGVAADLLTSHGAAVDPHPQYVQSAELTTLLGDYPTIQNVADSYQPISGALTDYATQSPSSYMLGLMATESLADLRDALGQPNGLASLDGAGKLFASQLPDLAISEFLGTAANQSAMLALTGQRGDWCLRSDSNTNWVLIAEPSNVIENWRQLAYPGTGVTSFNGRSGAVIPATGDYRVDQLLQTGAATNQAVVWNGTAWTPTTPTASMVTNAADLTATNVFLRNQIIRGELSATVLGTFQTSTGANIFRVLPTGLALHSNGSNRFATVTYDDPAGSLQYGRNDHSSRLDFIPNSNAIVMRSSTTSALFAISNAGSDIVICPAEAGGDRNIDLGRRWTDNNTSVGAVVRVWVRSGTAQNPFQILAPGGLSQLLAIRADGSIRMASIADAAAVNDSLYISQTTGKITYKDSTGTLRVWY